MICESRTQDCEVCVGEDVQLTSNLSSPNLPITYSWVCTNGFMSTIASPLVPNVTSNTTCTLNAIDAANCMLTEDLIVDVFSNPNIVISLSDCNILFFQNDPMGQNCTTYEVQRLVGAIWTTISTALPYTATVDGDYRVVYVCECGDVITNTVSVVNCTPCSPFNIFDFGCSMVVSGFAPCGAGGYEVWANINAGQSCSPDTPPCDEGSMTFIGTTPSNTSFFSISSDGCYQYRCTSGSVDYCSNIICYDDDCEVGCNDALVFTTSPTNPPCTPFSSIIWPCSGIGNWSITQGGTTITSGTNNPPSNYTFTMDGTYVFTMTCNDGCIYSNQYTVSGCGSPPCTPPSSLTIIDNNCTLTALVNNCDGTPSYSWSNSATTQSITVTNNGTYTVTVTGCCVSPLVSSITVSCIDPCDGFSNSIVGDLVLCDGDMETYTANITGGTPAFSYSWSLNSTIVSISNNYTYTHNGNTDNLILTVTDANNCVSVTSVFITEDNNCCVPQVSLQFSGSGVNETILCSSIDFEIVNFSDFSSPCECLQQFITITYDYQIQSNAGVLFSGSTSDVLEVDGFPNIMNMPFDFCLANLGDLLRVSYTIISDDSNCDIIFQNDIQPPGFFFMNVSQQNLDDCNCP